ncbi:putative solute carrier family 2, facilitated glucose transporter member 8 [Penaeus vannamei]|uniref:Putative solute carrier family 2, facilitated glucose transporter member 8 n=1 Tax=Penaeus vannamei TaxID=6689 RepID=A0A3R7SPS3_PENVA|nr:putative solute carrier family 2, facilitated glucose transporter member 8 [Penaeus vannamei]
MLPEGDTMPLGEDLKPAADPPIPAKSSHVPRNPLPLRGPQDREGLAAGEAAAEAGRARISTQVAACLAIATGQLALGAVNGWSGAALPDLAADPDLAISTSQAAWIVSMIAVGALASSAVASRVMDAVGRRATLLATAPLMVAGLARGRPRAPRRGPHRRAGARGVYSSETPEARLRGRLASIPSLFITLGFLLSYLAGALCSWRSSCYVCSVPAFLMFLALTLVPESPYWLLLKGRREDAARALRWLRGPRYDIASELKEMDAKISSVGASLQYRELLRRRTRVPFLTALFMQATQQVGGGNILVMYTATVFQSAGVDNPQLSTVYMGVCQLTATGVSVLLMDKFGRRPLIVLSTLILGAAGITLSGYYYLRDEGAALPGWVALVAVLVAASGYCLGCRTVPWLLAAELFNTTVRSTANSACIFFNRLLNLTMIQVFPHFKEAAGASTVFLMHGSLSLVCGLITLFCVPETKGKTLEEIQDYFEEKRIGWWRKGGRDLQTSVMVKNQENA